MVGPGEMAHLRPPVFRAQGNLLSAIVDAENFWCADLEAGFAFGWLTEGAVQNLAYVRYHFIEAMIYSLIESLHCYTVHAACVVFNGHGVLLAGDSGAGKSSLAYACARRGWTYVSDDASSLVRRANDCTVLGNPGAFRFRASAGSLFPEFRGRRESPYSNGKPTIEVETASLGDVVTAPEAHVDHIVFLNRSPTMRGATSVCAVTPEGARSRLGWFPWPRELQAFTAYPGVLERLLRTRLLEIRYRDLDSAVNMLERVIEEG